MNTGDYLIIFSKILGSLALLIYGMKVMSEALQKMAGSQLRHILGAMTTNRFTGLLTGTFITCAVQSSSATTVMTVSFVNAGLLTLAQAISVIMGANIGTTLTAWIMSLGYSVDLSLAVYPAFYIGIFLIYARQKYRYTGDFLFGLAFMFLSLVILSTAGKELRLQENPDVVSFFASFDTKSYFTILAFLAIGTAITCVVQSSAAVMAITILMCSTGVLPIYLGVALVMGENIGTTITANLAALAANTQARRAAMAHLMFNVTGVVWVLILFYPFVNTICRMVGFNPQAVNPDHAVLAIQLPVVLAAFHTSFNVLNTALLIWFIPVIEKMVCFLIKNRKAKDEEDFKLEYIQAGIMKTPELSVLAARKEIISFAIRMQRMFGMVGDLLVEKNETKFVKLFSRIEKYEAISDNMELEIANYLEKVSDAHLSDETKGKIRAMLREISELESIGDSCYNIARCLNRKWTGKEDFTEKQYEHIHQMMELTNNALEQMNATLSGRKDEYDINQTMNIENEINNFRNQLKAQNINDIDQHKYNYAIGTMYMDIVNECEKLADYVVNVVEARLLKAK